MNSPPPPSQKQAAEAQRARYAAETAILSLFKSSAEGGGAGEGETSILHTIKISTILTALSAAIVFSSFRHPQDKTKSMLLGAPDNEQISDKILSEAQRVFRELADSVLSDSQKAVLWATWAYSKTADEIADAVNNGEIEHLFSDRNVRLKKIWISRSDRRVRPLHARLHGKTVLSTSDFWRWPATGQRLRWPGDRDAPADATIGCRCVCLLSWSTQDEVSKTIRDIVEHTRK